MVPSPRRHGNRFRGGDVRAVRGGNDANSQSLFRGPGRSGCVHDPSASCRSSPRPWGAASDGFHHGRPRDTGGYAVQVQRPEQAMVTADLSVSTDSAVSLAEDGSLLMTSPTSSELVPAVLDLGSGRRAVGTWELVSSTHAIYSASVSTGMDSGSVRVMSSFDWDCSNERIRDGFITGTIGGCIAGSAGGCMVGGVSGAFGGAVTGLIDCW